MVKSTNLQQQPPPLSVIRGELVKASYMEQSVPEYEGNPLIEALPRLWAKDEVEEMLTYFPHYDNNQRKLPAEVRLHLLENMREFFIPQGIHYELHLSISNMLRRGYIDRNPVKRGAGREHVKKLEKLDQSLQKRAFLRSRARGLCIIGPGGVGKTTGVENILYKYPQVIDHARYKDQDLILRQLVWVKLQCPSDGSLKGLCLSFIQEVDDILGTSYMKFYSAHRKTIDELLLIMARVASLHYTGLVAFDEIQDLSDAKSGGAVRMLNFFVQLENILGIPFILIGTRKAMDILLGEFRQARRVSEQGDLFWRPMAEFAEKHRDDEADNPDIEWDIFIRVMWKYWYLKKDHPLPKNLLEDKTVHELYAASKGITALVVTIFFLAQRRAIVTGLEDLSVKVIQQVVKDNQYLITEYLNRLKEGQNSRKSTYGNSDLAPREWNPSMTLQSGTAK